jgi:hypothetical protein
MGCRWTVGGVGVGGEEGQGATMRSFGRVAVGGCTVYVPGTGLGLSTAQRL